MAKHNCLVSTLDLQLASFLWFLSLEGSCRAICFKSLLSKQIDGSWHQVSVSKQAKCLLLAEVQLVSTFGFLGLPEEDLLSTKVLSDLPPGRSSNFGLQNDPLSAGGSMWPTIRGEIVPKWPGGLVAFGAVSVAWKRGGGGWRQKAFGEEK